ncbi:MAG: phosphoribosylanthranilate isomerase [Cyclobacteriaceae bacterium]|nr:phosphoribosylanthranilate isomerase [Cyclobacteriaceae bacterium]
MKLKICGMRDAENIQQVAKLKPDYMGFIFYEKSPRFVGENFLLPEDLSPEIKRVGVFVDQPEDYILAKAWKYGLSCIQLHGSESPDLCQALQKKNLMVIKVFSMDDSFNFMMLTPYRNVVDYFLFDTKGVYFGGNGVTFDWNMLTNYQFDFPFFLSGGLSPENILQVQELKLEKLYGVDVNSGLESSPGFKNLEKVRLLISKLDNLKLNT